MRFSSSCTYQGRKNSIRQADDRCKKCGRYLTEDYGSLTHHSHLSVEAWNEAIKLNIKGESLKSIAATVKVSKPIAFAMRHKIMIALDQDGIVLTEDVEFDEKYLLKSHNGTQIVGVKGKKGEEESASLRGLSNEQVFLLSSVQRGGSSFLRAHNMTKPSIKEVMNLKPHIEQETLLWIDDLSSYGSLALELHSARLILSSKEVYDRINHLNTLYLFHSGIDV